MKEKKEDIVLTLFNREIVIMYEIHDPTEHLKPWENNGIFICDPKKNIRTLEIINIIEYLYEEGFIDDRRTPYEILTDDM
tara:strand:- start:1604 stop:1843 length:240 start_codon:yes stop_codon:yes gene_type:complete